MELVGINGKIKIISLIVAFISVIASVTISKNISLTVQTEDLVNMQQKVAQEAELENKINEVQIKIDSINIEAKEKFYTDFYTTVADVNDDIKTKKEELKTLIPKMKEKKQNCENEFQKICNSLGFGVEKQIQMIDNFVSVGVYHELEVSIGDCERKKLQIDNAVKAYNEEQDAMKKAQVEAENSKKTENSNKKSSSKSNSYNTYSSSEGGSYSSGGGSYGESENERNSYSSESNSDVSNSIGSERWL